MNKKDAKAQGRAAKAYSKSQRNWFSRHKFLSALGALVVIIIVFFVIKSTSGGSSSDNAGASGGGATTFAPTRQLGSMWTRTTS